jgi:hypothetical protein
MTAPNTFMTHVWIAQTVSDAGGPKAVIKLVSDFSNIRLRQYEIWFTANAL